MDVLQRKCPDGAFLRIKADRDTLYDANVIDCTFHIKVCQRDMAAGLVDLDGGDGGRDLLDQC